MILNGVEYKPSKKLPKKKKKKATILGTAANIGTALGRGALGFGEGISDFTLNRVADVAGALGNTNLRNNILSTTKEFTTGKVVKKAEQAYDPISTKFFQKGQLGNQVAEGVGQLVGMVATGKVIPTKLSKIPVGKIPVIKKVPLLKNLAMPTTAVIGGMGAGQSEALQSGATYGESLRYGLGKGVIEGLSEGISGAITFPKLSKVLGTGPIDDIIVKLIDKNVKSAVGRFAAKTAVSGIGEGLEENFSGLLTPYLQRMTYDEKAKLYDSKQAWNDFIVSALTTSIVQSPGIMLELQKGNTSEPLNVEEFVKEVAKGVTIDGILKETNDSLGNIATFEDDFIGKEDTKIEGLDPVMLANEVATLDPLITTLNEKLAVEPNVKKQQELMDQIENLEVVKKNKETQIRLYVADTKATTPEENVKKVVENVVVTTDIASAALDLLVSEQKTKFNNLDAQAEFDNDNPIIAQAQKMGAILNLSVNGYKSNFTTAGMQKGNVVLLNTDSQQLQEMTKEESIYWTFGHEVFHYLKQNNQKLFNKYIEYIKGSKYIKEQIANYTNGITNEAYKQSLIENPDTVIEEMAADEMGNLFNDKGFWKEMQTKDKSLFKKISEFISSILDTFSGAKVDNGLSTSQINFMRENLVKDLTEIRDVASTKKKSVEQLKEIKSKVIPPKVVKAVEQPKKAVEKVVKEKIPKKVEPIKEKELTVEEKLAQKRRELRRQQPTLGQIADRYNLSDKEKEARTMDNQGRELTKEQQTLFDDSVGKDNDGNLKAYYNNSNEEFDTFEYSKITGGSRAQHGLGFYFGDNKEKVSAFGNKTKEVYLNIKNPLRLKYDNKISNENISKIVSSLDNKSLENFKTYLKSEDVTKELQNLKTNELLMKVFSINVDRNKYKNFIENFSKITGYDGIIPTIDNRVMVAFFPNQIKRVTNTTPTIANDMNYSNKKQLPKVPDVKVTTGSGKSQFATNTLQKQVILSPETVGSLVTNKDISNYKETSNEGDIRKAIDMLKKDGNKAIQKWFNNESPNSVDIAMGSILLDQYNKAGDTRATTAITKKLRNILTIGGQTVQAAKILQKLTPEGMVFYTQSELWEAWEKINEINDPKINEWAQKNKHKFTLNGTEIKYINDRMVRYQKLDPESREAKIILAEIQALPQSKIPPEKGSWIKAWTRISMLLNFRTLEKNVIGNLGILPVNIVGDFLGSKVDTQLAKKTGVRTTGKIQKRLYLQGLKKGVEFAIDDFKRGINTSNTNKFESATGDSFKNTNFANRFLNKTSRVLYLGLSMGDRPFFEAEYENSLSNQMKLNNTNTPTKDMEEIAVNTALQRTWQDKNKFVEAALGLRSAANKLNINGYGLGDMLAPFIITPANLAKAVYDYSPVALASALMVEGKNYNNAVKLGRVTPQLQRAYVNSLSKAMAGSFMYIIGAILANSGLISGGDDKDKDKANFMKMLGIKPYSFRIGDKSYTYDWIQPMATPFAIMADVKKMSDDDTLNKGKGMDLGKGANIILNSMALGGNTLYEQSFLQSFSNLFNSGSPVQGLIKNTSQLPTRFVPTLLKQIADASDPYVRQTFVYNDVLATSRNAIYNRIPIRNRGLAIQKDTLGRDVKKNLNLFDIFFNPSNKAKDTSTKVTDEIQNVYNVIGDNAIFPKYAPNYVRYKNKTINLTPKETLRYQETIGKSANSILTELITNDGYRNLTYQQKSDIIKETVNYGTQLAKEELFSDYKVDSNVTNIRTYESKGLQPSSYMIYKQVVSKIEPDRDIEDKAIEGSTQGKKAKAIMDMNISDIQKNIMLDLITTSKTPANVNDLQGLNTKEQYTSYFALPANDFFIQKKISRVDYQNAIDVGISRDVFTKYATDVSKLKADVDRKGNTIANSKKKKVLAYINSLPLNGYQRLVLLSAQGYSIKSYRSQMLKYVNSLPISKERKLQMWEELGY